MDRQDASLIVLLSTSSASLADKPGNDDNWIERAGGELPPYVRKIARAIMKSGKSKSQAIAIAISRMKKWAAGGEDVDADTRAKAAKALASWEALKAKNAAKKLVKAARADGSSYLMLSNLGSFNTDLVRRAWSAHSRPHHDGPYEVSAYSYITELWTDHIIVEREYDGDRPRYVRVNYSVVGDDVIFGDEVEVKHAWIEADEQLTLDEVRLLVDLV